MPSPRYRLGWRKGGRVGAPRALESVLWRLRSPSSGPLSATWTPLVSLQQGRSGGFGDDPKWPMCLAGALVLMRAGSAS